jgi:hypothetical protein
VIGQVQCKGNIEIINCFDMLWRATVKVVDNMLVLKRNTEEKLTEENTRVLKMLK